MWWFFLKESETRNRITYRYSTDSDSLDGLIIYNRATDRSTVFAPCRKDRQDPWRRFRLDLTLERFERWIVWPGFPERQTVIVG